MRVGIIGAGIGGTCLAHGLRRNGVNVVVFERNPESSSGLPGYGIHINVFGQEALEECLPSQSWKAFLKVARPIGGQTRFYDEDLELLAAQQGAHRMDGHIVAERRLSISRSELIDILSGGLDAAVRREKEFRHFERLDGAGVRVTFADGTQECVDVLVGADGANSRVRKQYLPKIERFDVGVSVIVGRSRLTPELAAEVPADLIDGSPNSIVPRSSDWMFVSVWRAPVDTSAAVKDAQIDTYVVWAYIVATRDYQENLAQMSAVALCDIVRARTTKWHPSIHRLIEQSDLPSVNLVTLRTMPHLDPWDTSSVTLLGDAIHNMTPMAGVGANTALRDAQLLSRALTKASAGTIDLVSTIAGYEREMRAYGNVAVALSLRNARNAVDSSKLKRQVFRAVLRLSQAIPPFKSALFPAGR